MLAFSDDSELVLIETGNINPLRVFNLTDYTVKLNIPETGIYSLSFLDNSNRFVLLRTISSTQIYDLK